MARHRGKWAHIRYTTVDGDFVKGSHFEVCIYKPGDYFAEGVVVKRDAPSEVIEFTAKEFLAFIDDAIPMAVSMGAWRRK
jgi:hypothetical protein